MSIDTEHVEQRGQGCLSWRQALAAIAVLIVLAAVAYCLGDPETPYRTPTASDPCDDPEVRAAFRALTRGDRPSMSTPEFRRLRRQAAPCLDR